MTEETSTAITTEAEQPAAEPVPTPIAHVIYSGEHEKLVPLQWPIEFDGKVYDQIRVHRLSGKQVRDYLEALRGSPLFFEIRDLQPVAGRKSAQMPSRAPFEHGRDRRTA